MFLCGVTSAFVERRGSIEFRVSFAPLGMLTLKDFSVSGNWDLFLDRIYVIPGGQQVLCVDCIWQPCVLGTQEWLT